jgi:parallel beta-helix repeat protein
VNPKVSRASAAVAVISLVCLFDTGCSVFSPTKQQTPAQPASLSISGTITPSSGGVGVTVLLSSPSFSTTTTTDSSGNYRFNGLDSGAYTVTPEKSNVQFTPAKQSTTIGELGVAGINFKAIAHDPHTFSLSGSISPAASGAGATVRLSGTASASTVTDSSGNFQFSGLPRGTYTLTPSNHHLKFTPTTRATVVKESDVTGLNFTITQDAPGTTYSLSGTISPADLGAGATLTLGGAANVTTVADSSGNFQFTGLASGSYSLTPSKVSFTFIPATQHAMIGANDASGVDFTILQRRTNIVSIHPGQDIPNIVAASPAGTTFLVYPGLYRLKQPITPKDGDSFIGQTACAPPASSCPAIISGSAVIGGIAAFDGGNYKVTNQTQSNKRGQNGVCDAGWEGCIYPEDLFFDGVPYKHLSSSVLPTIRSGQWWFDYPNHTIYFHDNPAGHLVETSVVEHAFAGPANNVTIQYLTVKEFADMYGVGAIGATQEGQALTQETDWTVQNSEMLLNHSYGVRVNYRMKILNNYIHDNGQNGIGGGLGVTEVPATESINSGIVIEGNVVNHNDYAHFNPGFGSGGIKIGATSGVTIRGNTIQYNEGEGIHFDDYSQNEFVDGNTITDNIDAGGIAEEISYGTSTIRNNIVLRNGKEVNDTIWSPQILSLASSGLNAYCNVMEVSTSPNINAWAVVSSNRGNSQYPPYQYLASTRNYFHHNTIIWNPGVTNGAAGAWQGDTGGQPNFYNANTPPDHNTYHLPGTVHHFVYQGTQLSFVGFQANGADIHGSADANNTSGFPAVTITSPPDQSSFQGPLTVGATASDASGISRVEFYLDWSLQATVAGPPYVLKFTNVAAGSHTVTAMAYSNAGIRSCYAITVTKQ